MEKKKKINKDLIIADLQGQNQELKEALKNYIEESLACGEHLRAELFIPEYLGFEETIIDNADLTTTRIYTRNGFGVSRVKDSLWVVMMPDSSKIQVEIKNMLQGITILSALRCPIDVDTLTKREVDLKEVNDLINKKLLAVKED